MKTLDGAYVMFAVTVFYAYIYSRMDPKEFGFKDPIDPIYFSFTTMSTIGYGDFSPKTPRAKMLVMTQQSLIVITIYSATRS